MKGARRCVAPLLGPRHAVPSVELYYLREFSEQGYAWHEAYGGGKYHDAGSGQGSFLGISWEQ